MNKKGFTLIEVLSVISVIGILIAIVVPNARSVIDASKKSAFLGDAQAVYRAARLKAIDVVNTSNIRVIGSNKSIKLDLDGKSVDYCVIIDDEALITSITVSDGTYFITGDADFLSLDVDSITLGNMDDFVCE